MRKPPCFPDSLHIPNSSVGELGSPIHLLLDFLKTKEFRQADMGLILAFYRGPKICYIQNLFLELAGFGP